MACGALPEFGLPPQAEANTAAPTMTPMAAIATRTPLRRSPRLQRFLAALPTRTGCHSGAWRVAVQELVGVRMSVAVQAFARQGRSSIDSQALRVPAYP